MIVLRFTMISLLLVLTSEEALWARAETAAPSLCRQAIDELSDSLARATLNRDPIILGAGPVGLTLSIHLASLGYQPVVVEQRGDPRSVDIDRSRTFNLTLATRGLSALPDSVRSRVLEVSSPAVGRLIHHPDGSFAQQNYGRHPDQVLQSISRRELARILVDEAQRLGVQIFFETKVENLKLAPESSEISLSRDGERLQLEISGIVGTDGSGSKVRSAIAEATEAKESSVILPTAYKAFEVQPEEGSPLKTWKNWLHLWPRGETTVTGIPNAGEKMSMILVLPLKGPLSFESLQTEEDYYDLFLRFYPDLLAAYPQLPRFLFGQTLGTIRRSSIEKWNFHAEALVLGDAAHSMSYFYGQGANTGLEDVRIFAELVVQKTHWTDAIEKFAQDRPLDTQFIQTASDKNLKILTSQSASKGYQARRALERELARRYPEKFVPEYELVVFSNRPQREVFSQIEEQEAILDRIMEQGQEVDWQKVDEWISALSTMSHQREVDLIRHRQF